jgi:hypothetical protein
VDKKRLIRLSIAILLVGGVLAIYFRSAAPPNSKPKLKLEARSDGYLIVTNLYSEPITISHLEINNRPECGTISKMELKIGDVKFVPTLCPIATVAIETDHGPIEYSFK